MHFHTFVLKNVFRRRIRSTLTMTGVAIAVGAVVALVGISDGFSRSMLELYQRRDMALVVSRADSVNPLSGALDERVGHEIAGPGRRGLDLPGTGRHWCRWRTCNSTTW